MVFAGKEMIHIDEASALYIPHDRMMIAIKLEGIPLKLVFARPTRVSCLDSGFKIVMLQLRS